MSLRTGVPELIVALDAAPELYTVLYTIVVSGVGFSSTSAIMSLTAFAVKSLSLKSVRQLFWPSITACNLFKRVLMERNLD